MVTVAVLIVLTVLALAVIVVAAVLRRSKREHERILSDLRKAGQAYGLQQEAERLRDSVIALNDTLKEGLEGDSASNEGSSGNNPGESSRPAVARSEHAGGPTWKPSALGRALSDRGMTPPKHHLASEKASPLDLWADRLGQVEAWPLVSVYDWPSAGSTGAAGHKKERHRDEVLMASSAIAALLGEIAHTNIGRATEE